MVYLKCFGEGVTVLNYLALQKVSSLSFPLDSFIMEIFFTLGSLFCVFV